MKVNNPIVADILIKISHKGGLLNNKTIGGIMMTKGKEVLANVGDVEVLASRFGVDWLDPVLTMKFNEKELQLTTDAGEFDNDFGEFVINTDSFTDTELAMIKEVLDEIADESSIMEFKEIGLTKFALNQEHLEELDIIDDNN